MNKRPPPITPKKPVNKCLSKAEAGDVSQSPELCVRTAASTGAIIVMLSLVGAALRFENEMIGLLTHDKHIIHESSWGTWLIASVTTSVSQPVSKFLLAATQLVTCVLEELHCFLL